MNAERRKDISNLTLRIGELNVELENLRDEEQEYYDTMPENFQNGDKGEASQAALDSLQQTCDSLEEAMLALGEIE